VTREREEDVLSEDEEDEQDHDDPTDPSHPDWDLSVSAPYDFDVHPDKPWYMRRWLLLVIAFLVITSLLLPFIQRL
jgi:hypothetical protein